MTGIRPRFCIGIDLGTSNCALSYVDLLDTQQNKGESKSLSIPQYYLEESITEESLLPSSLLLKADPSLKRFCYPPKLAGDMSIVIGKYARNHEALNPGRVVVSAKSWLCHGGVDREEKILPWRSGTIEEERRLSPVTASALLLAHLKGIWDGRMAASEQAYALQHQNVIITIPASFDEVAQRLTLEAARLAGFPQSTQLLEEPQAAFYYFLEKHGESFSSEPSLTKRPLAILVCDVGGGTTDFGLFTLRSDQTLERVAVGEHLLLGGDNIDLALAHLVEKRLAVKLSPRRWSLLLAQVREIKEEKFSDQFGTSCRITLPSDSSSLFSDTLALDLDSSELREILLDGFLPSCAADEGPATSPSGVREYGLPFVHDPAITRHLALFLRTHKNAVPRVDAVLFTGGSLKPDLFRDRIIDQITLWQDGLRPFILPNSAMDHAVAHGAARFGFLLHHQAPRIRAGYPHSLYLEVRRGKQSVLICILAKGTPPGHVEKVTQHKLAARVGEGVRFQLVRSRSRASDLVGDIVSLNELPDATPLPPLQTVLGHSEGSKMGAAKRGIQEVFLEIRLSETGILKLLCAGANTDATSGEPPEWHLDFNLRQGQTPHVVLDADTQLDPEKQQVATRAVSNKAIQDAANKISLFYGSRRTIDSNESVKKLPRELEGILRLKREDWDIATLRALWGPLSQGITKRGRSPDHEMVFYSLAGLLLRPGFGYELDEYRIVEIWRCFDLGLEYPKERSVTTQWWIMWRRIAGGLSRDQQQRLFQDARRAAATSPEALRLAAALERVAEGLKIALINELVTRITARPSNISPEESWGLQRLLARESIYGGSQSVISSDAVQQAFDKLKSLDWRAREFSPLRNIFLHAAKLTGDRHRDLPDTLREAIATKLRLSGLPQSELRSLHEIISDSLSYRTALSGDSLPLGLSLID